MINNKQNEVRDREWVFCEKFANDEPNSLSFYSYGRLQTTVLGASYGIYLH